MDECFFFVEVLIFRRVRENNGVFCVFFCVGWGGVEDLGRGELVLGVGWGGG